MAGASAGHHHVDWFYIVYFGNNLRCRRPDTKGRIIPYPL